MPTITTKDGAQIYCGLGIRAGAANEDCGIGCHDGCPQ